MINSAKIKARAKDLGIRQSDLAALIGIKQSTVNQKINNVRPMSLNEAEIIAKALQIEDVEFADYFFRTAYGFRKCGRPAPGAIPIASTSDC